jgi:putative salt-induced outer membrane protein YdiY
MRICRHFFWALITVAGGSISAWADEDITVELANGDRLTGRLIQQTEDHIVFHSPVLGELRLSTAQAAILPAEEPASPAETAVDTSAQAIALAGAPPPVPAAAQPPPWQGTVEFGYQQQSGQRDTLNLNLRGTAELKRGRSNYQIEGRMLYGEQQGRTNVDRSDASFRWRRNLNQDFFTQAATSYSRDQVRQIDHNFEQNFGAGYRLFSSDLHTLNLGAGLTGQYRENRGVDPGTYALVEVFQDYTLRINGRLTLRQNVVAQYTPDGQGSFVIVANQPRPTTDGEPNYKLRLNTALQGKMTDRISLNLRYEYEYDNAIVALNSAADHRITSSIGYAF